MTSFWSKTTSHAAVGESIHIHIHCPDLKNRVTTVRANDKQVMIGLDGNGIGVGRVVPEKEGLVVCSHPNVAHHAVYVGETVPDRYLDGAGCVIIPPAEDPGEDPDPDLTAPVESASSSEEASELELREGESPIRLEDLDEPTG